VLIAFLSIPIRRAGVQKIWSALGVCDDERTEFRGRHRQNGAAHVFQPSLDRRIGEASVDLLVELVDDFGGRGRG
jgi:hypothetical protein